MGTGAGGTGVGGDPPAQSTVVKVAPLTRSTSGFTSCLKAGSERSTWSAAQPGHLSLMGTVVLKSSVRRSLVAIEIGGRTEFSSDNIKY